MLLAASITSNPSKAYLIATPSRSCSPAAFALSSSAASVSGLIPFRAADAKRAQAPTLSFSSVGVSSWWLDNIHNVSVLGDHFD